jgi:hypothetical protein
MQRDSNQLPATQPNPFGYAYNEWESHLGYVTTPTTCDDACCVDCLPDETVCSILARYQGLRVLEDLWLERQLASSDFFSADENPGSDALNLLSSYQGIINRNELYSDGEMPSRRRQTPETSAYTRLNSDQRGRFYSAIIYVWLLNEIRWVLTNFTFPARFDVQIKLLESIKESVSAQRHVSLLDELDHYAVFKFIYHHLLPVYSTYSEGKEIARLPFTFSSNFTSDPGYSARYVQPHMIALYTSHPILTSGTESSNSSSSQAKPTSNPQTSSTSSPAAKHPAAPRTHPSNSPNQQSRGTVPRNSSHSHAS